MRLLGAGRSPDLLQQHPVRDHEADVLGQNLEQAILDRRQVDFLSSDEYLSTQ